MENNDPLNDPHDPSHKHEHHDPFHEAIRGMQMLGGLRLWIMHVLDENGLTNGAEIMAAVQAHTNLTPDGPYKNAGPLPGSIYPMLKKMVSEDLIYKNSKGQYDLTDNGKKLNSKFMGRFQADDNKDNVPRVWSIDNILTEIENDISYLEDIKTEKLDPKRKIIKNLTERLIEINKSLE